MAGLAGLLVLVGASLYGLLYTEWFQQQIRREVVAQIELLTGGRATIGSLYFEPATFVLRVEDLTVRATDDAEPFLEVPSLELHLKVDSFFRREVSLAALVVHSPLVHITAGPDGSTNLPLSQAAAGEHALAEEIFQLAVGRFDLRRGQLKWNNEQIPIAFSSTGLELRTRFYPHEQSYRAWMRVGTSELDMRGRRPVLSEAEMEVIVYRDRIVIPEIYWASAGTKVFGGLEVESIKEPRAVFRYQAEVALAEWASWLGSAPLAGTAKTSGEARWESASGQLQYGGRLSVENLRPGYDEFTIEPLFGSALYEGDLESLRMREIEAKAFGGRLSGEGQIDELSAAAPHFRFAMDLEGFPLDHITAAVRDLPDAFRNSPWVTALSGAVELSGRGAADLRANVDLQLDRPGFVPDGKIPLSGELDVAYEAASGTLTVAALDLASPSSQLALTGAIKRGGPTSFRVHARMDELEDLRRGLHQAGFDDVLEDLELRGRAELSGDVSGDLAAAGLRFGGKLEVADFTIRNHRWDKFLADLDLSPSRLQLRNARLEDRGGTALISLAADLGRLDGEETVSVSSVDGEITLRNVQVAPLLASAGYEQPVTGALNGAVRFSGPPSGPRGSAELELTAGTAWGQSFDRVGMEMHLTADELVLDSLQVQRREAQMKGRGSVDRSGAEFRFEAAGDGWDLKDLEQFAESKRPPTGHLSFEMEGRGRLPSGKDVFDEISVAGSFELEEVKLGESEIGSLSGKLSTQGRRVDLGWEGNLLSGKVTGHAEFRPDGEGPFNGESTVKGLNLVDLAGLADLNLQQTRGEVDGALKFSGLMTNADSFAAEGEFTRFQLTYSQIPGAKRGYELWNPFSLRWKLAGDTLNIDRMRLLGDGTDIVVDGTVGLEDGFAGSEDSMNLTVEGIFNLAVLESFRPGLEASGESELDVRIAGSANQPAVRGRMGIKGGALRHSSFSNGLSALNGMVRFNEDTIQVEEVTAESGGGRLRLNGTAVREADRWDYRLQGQIESVRVRYPESLSSVVDGQLTYSGTDLRSLLAGEVVVSRVGIGSELSLGDIIASLAEPTKTPASNAALVNMGLSVRIASVPNLSIETPLIRDVQAYMDLQLGGTAVSPSLRGDMKITQGQVLFQGSRYTITRGDINFYNPFRIEPVVNIELETRIRDVDIALTISGPARLPNLSYRSDPPLRWDELFNLIALARSPTTDPVLASQQTIQQQSLIQGGGNAVFYRALTNPATGGSGRGSQRLQRFFGVSRLKVDPRGGAELNPGARISTEQQITHDLTLLYSYDLSEAQQQVVRVEWTPVRQWSFIVTRDENGLVGADVIFNKRLR